jgi:threonine/homoserine/homoserine lactone efflux protein
MVLAAGGAERLEARPMDSVSFLAALLAVHAGAVATPGPNTLLVSNIAAAGARRTAMWAAAGTGAGAVVWVAATLGGASALLAAVPRLADVLRWLGGAYLVFLGAQASFSAWRSRSAETAPAVFAPASAAVAFRRGLVTNLSNPKSMAYYLSLLVASAAPDAPLWVRIAGGAGMAAISLGWYLLLAWAFSGGPVRGLYRKAQPVVAGATGVLMIGFGLALVFLA